MSVEINLTAIRQDRQHAKPLKAAVDAAVAATFRFTSAPIQARAGKVEWGTDGPTVIFGAKHAGAVAVEFGTALRPPSAPMRKAAMSVGLKQ